ncbi:uncharacterized protein [Watersipora subatra]|uniref:uncharacterized protein n=1 Tax=Watersipora subatra TaxID=2589382 RepID=UPI00355B5BB0
MYPVEPIPPDRKLASLTQIKDIEDVHKKIISGYCIKAMASDPYGHPIFAVQDGKIGSLIVYETNDEQILRKIGAGYHEIESITFDSSYNMTMTSDKAAEHKIMKYNLKGDEVLSACIEEVKKLYSIACMGNGCMAVSLVQSDGYPAIRVYDQQGERIKLTICRTEQGTLYFTKPQYLVSTGETLVVGDVGTKNLRGFSTQTESQLLWTYKMDMPRGMCVDGAGNICACDFRNNRVTLLTAEGALIGHSLTGLSKPQQIAINHNKLFTLDMGRSTSYRISTHCLFKTPKAKRKSISQPEWQ